MKLDSLHPDTDTNAADLSFLVDSPLHSFLLLVVLRLMIANISISRTLNRYRLLLQPELSSKSHGGSNDQLKTARALLRRPRSVALRVRDDDFKLLRGMIFQCSPIVARLWVIHRAVEGVLNSVEG